ncbi:hypothetical protein EZS27_014821 [termite gut metagenome]|uniref:DUF362 domain-containing protein n=1 Tax=termite gut metagenome TaxID=433724 RepID=A0A5J4RTL2_9ZZZZ
MKNLYWYLKEKSERMGNSSFKGKAIFIIAGLAATAWFLIRVIPKPSRATYPCMQAAAPTMSAFVIYILSLMGGIKAWNAVKKNWKIRKYRISAMAFVILICCSGIFIFNKPDVSFARMLQLNNAPLFSYPPNEYAGEAQGVFPGRVVWAHASGAATWKSGQGYWFEDKYNNQTDCDWFIDQTLLQLTDTQNQKQAWSKLFSYHNEKKGKASKEYAKGEKMTIKINQNNTYSHSDSEELNASPHIVLALLASLINEAGVPQECITVTDPSRHITNFLYNKCISRFPNVNYMDHTGGDGRLKSDFVDDVLHFSQDNGKLARGISTAFAEADYVINMALLKGHEGQGVTLCGKNWYGTTSIHPDWRKNQHNNFDQSRQGKPKYMTFVDFMGHEYLGEKTMLWFIDGLYGSKYVGGAPTGYWTIPPFNNEWACSLFASLDPVAIDAVGLDFLVSQFPDMPDVNYSDTYLIEAALANNAPSGTKYDPEGDGTSLKSLGVFEHWNNPTDKQYSRNLGKSAGIELYYIKK